MLKRWNSDYLHQVVGEIAAGQVETEDGVRQSVALVDGHGVRHAVACIQHDAGGTTGRVQRQHGLDSDVHRRRVERLEHDLFTNTARHIRSSAAETAEIIILSAAGVRSIDISMFVCVCLYMCPFAYLNSCMSKLRPIFCTCCPWPWLGPLLATMQ